jgi:hypothetical protein
MKTGGGPLAALSPVPVEWRKRIRRHATGASVVWSLPLDGLLSTNLATVTFPDGSLAVGAGHRGPGLRVWLPAPH